MQHVNNVVYVNWIEQQAHEAWHACKCYPATLDLTRHYLQYRLPARSGDLLRLASAAARVGEVVVWRHQIFRDDTLLVEARSLE